jgi:hypothetical protein
LPSKQHQLVRLPQLNVQPNVDQGIGHTL